MSAPTLDAPATRPATGGALRARWWLCVLLAAAAACGGAQPPADPAAGEAPAESADRARVRAAAGDTVSDESAGDGASCAAGGGASGSARDVLVISGSRTVTADGTVRVELSPVYTYSTRSPLGRRKPPGDWVLDLLDGADGVLRSVEFATDTPINDIDPSTYQDSGALTEYWRVLVDDPPAYCSYRIRRGPLVVVESTVSPSAPTVTVTSPVAGQTVEGTMTVMWSASDADGDDLTYHVHYSSDGGDTYSAIGVGLSETSLLVKSLEYLEGSSQARVRVIASDGTRSTTAESAIFTLVSEYGGRVVIGAARPSDHPPVVGLSRTNSPVLL